MLRSNVKQIFKSGWYLFLFDFQYRMSLSYFGIFWVLVRPLANVLPILMVGNALGFGNDQNDLNYNVYFLSGFLSWNLFWESVVNCLTVTRRIRKVLKAVKPTVWVILIAASVHTLITFFLNLLVLIIAILYWQVALAPTVILFLFFLPVPIIAGYVIGLPIASLSYAFQDAHNGIGFLGQVLFWSAPIAHAAPTSGNLGTLIRYNPVTYLVNFTRSFLFSGNFQGDDLLVLLLSICLSFCVAVFFYMRTERVFVEYAI